MQRCFGIQFRKGMRRTHHDGCQSSCTFRVRDAHTEQGSPESEQETDGFDPQFHTASSALMQTA